MAEAGDPASCPDCGAPMRRLYDTTTPVIMRPWGYSLKPGEKGYWDGFDAPVPSPLTWQRGRGQKSEPGPQYDGVGIPYKS